MRRLIRGYDHALDKEVEIQPRDLKTRCEEVKRQGGRVARIGGDLTLFVRNKRGDRGGSVMKQTPKYTSRREFAKMIEKRAKELREIATRIREGFPDHGADAAEVQRACMDLVRVANSLRERAS